MCVCVCVYMCVYIRYIYIYISNEKKNAYILLIPPAFFCRYLLVVRNGALVGITTKRDILRRIHTFRGAKFGARPVNIKRAWQQ